MVVLPSIVLMTSIYLVLQQICTKHTKKLKKLSMVEQTPSNGYCQLVNPPMMKDGYTYRKTNNK